jgi:hypothetical protein
LACSGGAPQLDSDGGSSPVALVAPGVQLGELRRSFERVGDP